MHIQAGQLSGGGQGLRSRRAQDPPLSGSGVVAIEPRRMMGQNDEGHVMVPPAPEAQFRMVGDEVTLTAANPKLDVKVSLHPAFQCMVI